MMQKGFLSRRYATAKTAAGFITLTRSIRLPPYDICAVWDTRSPRYGIFSITTRCGTILKCSEQAEKLRRQCDELNATIQIIQQKVEFIDREQSSSQRGKFSVRTFPRRAFLHIGDEINLFTHELFYFYPTVGFYRGERKWFGALLYEDTPMQEYRFPELMAEQALSYIPAGEYLCGYHYGPYLSIQDSIDRLFEEASRRELRVDDCVITPNIVDQCCEGHPENYITGLEVRILPEEGIAAEEHLMPGPVG